MGSWDVYSFTNDDVMDLLGLPIECRIPTMDFEEKQPGEEVAIQELVKDLYRLELSDPHTVLYDLLEKAVYTITLIGIVVVFVANGYTVPKNILAIALNNLTDLFIDEGYSTWYGEKWPYRMRGMTREMQFLAEALNQY